MGIPRSHGGDHRLLNQVDLAGFCPQRGFLTPRAFSTLCDFRRDADNDAGAQEVVGGLCAV